MVDLLHIFILALPVAFAILAGRSLSDRNFVWLGIAGLAVASVYPIGHWYLLHYVFGVSANPHDKDDVVGSSVIWLVMIIEIPVCLITYLIARSISRVATKSYGDR